VTVGGLSLVQLFTARAVLPFAFINCSKTANTVRARSANSAARTLACLTCARVRTRERSANNTIDICSKKRIGMRARFEETKKSLVSDNLLLSYDVVRINTCIVELIERVVISLIFSTRVLSNDPKQTALKMWF